MNALVVDVARGVNNVTTMELSQCEQCGHHGFLCIADNAVSNERCAKLAWSVVSTMSADVWNALH